MKKLVRYSMAVLLCFSFLVGNFGLFASPICAVEGPEMVSVGEEKEPEAQEEERPTQDAQGRPILSRGATGVLMDGKSGHVLYESGGDKKMYPASTTKIMTALLALEAVEDKKLTLDQKITITEEMLEGLPWDGSSMALQEGEVISLQNLLYGLMIPSGNDAAMAISYMVSGTKSGFVDAMNQRAKEMGLTKTNFKNAHGLHDEKHYTTAKEMAVIAWHAMQNEHFREIVEIAHIKIPPTNKTKEERYYINTNGLVSTMRYAQFYYQGATGIKTGYTDEAGNCLVASAKKGEVELITVLFHGDGLEDSYQDSTRMLDYGFTAFELITPVKKDQILGEVKVKWGRTKESVTTSAVNPVSVLVPKGTETEKLEVKLELPEFVKAPVEKGAPVGTITVSLDGEIIGRGELHADLTVKRSFLWPIYAFFEWLWGFLLIRVICYLVLGVLGAFLLLVLVRIWVEFDKIRRRKQRYQKKNHRK